MKYTENEINFLKENYPKYGGKYCQPYLRNRKVDTINSIARRLGLSAKNKVVHPDLQKVSISKFQNIDKYVSYFLGYFWADGHILNYTSNNITHWRIALEIQEEDAIIILPIMNKIGKWSIQKRKRKKEWKRTWSFVTNNKDLYNFLFDNDYREKSIKEPTKILKIIPDDLHMYFWKGLVDGDSSLGLAGRGSYFELASSYDYEYSEFEKYILKFNIKGSIHRKISKKGHKSSVYKIYGKKILELESIFIDFGLSRKTKKFNLIKQKYENSTFNTKGFL